MTSVLKLIGRNQELFTDDISVHSDMLLKVISKSNFLVIGGAGSIG